MRILYGVFGYGRGHATRALTVLPRLTRRHEVLVLAGGDAYEALHREYRVLCLPRMGYVYGNTGQHSLFQTLRDNSGPLTQALLGTGEAARLRRQVEAFAPDTAISDAEPFTHRIAERIGIPRVSFDHFGLLAHCHVEIPWRARLRLERDVLAYRLLMGQAERHIVSSFFPSRPKAASVRCVGPLLRPEVRDLRATSSTHLLVYLNRGTHQLHRRLRDELARLGIPIVVYGVGEGSFGALRFRKADNLRFLDDLASARGVISTAGNQLVGECIHFGKPLLVAPENTLEQQLNAAAVERFGLGAKVELSVLGVPRLRRFLRDLETYQPGLTTMRDRKDADAELVLEDTLQTLRSSSERVALRRFGFA